MCHYTDLGSASAMLKKIHFAARPIRSTTQVWIVTRHQCVTSTRVSPQTSFRRETSGGVSKYQLFSQPRSQGSLWLWGKKRENPGNEVALFAAYRGFWLLLTHSTHLLKDSAHSPTELAPRSNPAQCHRRLLLCRLYNLHQPMSLWKKKQYHEQLNKRTSETAL